VRQGFKLCNIHKEIGHKEFEAAIHMELVRYTQYTPLPPPQPCTLNP